MYVKINLKEITDEKMVFEFLTRSPFIERWFEMLKSDDLYSFNDVFADVRKEKTTTEEEANFNKEGMDKRGIYSCTNEVWEEKLVWWCANINKTERVINKLDSVEGSSDDRLALMDISDEYKEKFKEGVYEMRKDFKWFKNFFDTSIEIDRKEDYATLAKVFGTAIEEYEEQVEDTYIDVLSENTIDEEEGLMTICKEERY